MRVPQTGRWMRRKAQTEGGIAALRWRYPAKPGRALPCIRRGRCLHRPGNPVLLQTPSGGRDRPPYKAPQAGGNTKSTSLPPGPSAGRCSHRPANPAISQTLGGGRDRPPYIVAGAWRQRINASLPPGPCAEGRRSTTVIRPPGLPFPVWHPTAFAQRWDRLVRRGRVWYNSRKAARPVWLMPGRQPPLNAHGVMRGAKSSTLFCIPGRRGGPALAGPPTGEAG